MFKVLWSRPPGPMPALSRYTAWNGALYLAIGAFFYLFPRVPSAMLGQPPPSDAEAPLMRVVGMAVGLIGWFYVMGARTHAPSFGLATVADRLLVPFLLLPLWWFAGLDAALALPFAILDPALGLGAWWVWHRSGRPGAGG